MTAPPGTDQRLSVAANIRSTGAYFNESGDLIALIAAYRYGLAIRVLNSNGTHYDFTPGTSFGPTLHLAHIDDPAGGGRLSHWIALTPPALPDTTPEVPPATWTA